LARSRVMFVLGFALGIILGALGMACYLLFWGDR
jgi:hypothetical protein